VAHTVSVSLVLRLDDIATGRPVWPKDRSLRVCAGDGVSVPVAKNDGCFVFTGARPKVLYVSSDNYHEVTLKGIESAELLRVAMVPKTLSNRRLYTLDAKAGAYIGFHSERGGYALAKALSPGESEILLQKDDYADLIGLTHILMLPDGTESFVTIASCAGHGRYLLSEPLFLECPLRTRLLPLCYLYGGVFDIPVPEKTQYIYTIRNGIIYKEE
jgi:hypothetical protein